MCRPAAQLPGSRVFSANPFSGFSIQLLFSLYLIVTEILTAKGGNWAMKEGGQEGEMRGDEEEGLGRSPLPFP